MGPKGRSRTGLHTELESMLHRGSRDFAIFAAPIQGKPTNNRDMPTRIRLQRKGKKGQPYYHIVVADQRSPRDGKYIERIGAYDPNHNPAFVQIDRPRAIDWLQKGAQPSDTARAILSYTGLVYQNHLMNGVKKGAFDQVEADRRLDIWMNEKNAKVEAKRTKLSASASDAERSRVADETKKAEAMAAKLSAKLAAASAEAEPPAPVVAEEAAPVEAPAPEAETPAPPAEAASEDMAASAAE